MARGGAVSSARNAIKHPPKQGDVENIWQHGMAAGVAS